VLYNFDDGGSIFTKKNHEVIERQKEELMGKKGKSSTIIY